MSKEVICRFLNSKQTHFKIQPKGFRNAEFGQYYHKCAQYWQKASIHELSIYKL